MAKERLIETAETREGFIEVEPGWEIAYRWTPSATSANTAVFLNGLGDEHGSWDHMVKSLPHLNRLQLDLRGQGQSLTKRLSLHPDSPFRISIPTQSKDIAAALDHLGISGPVSLVGNSYGGGVAFDFASRYPERTKRLAVIVPYIVRLDRSFPLQRLWGWQWRTARGLGLIPASLAQSVESAYENFLSAYMNQRFQKRMGTEDQRRVAIELSHGIMEFDAFQVLHQLPNQGVFLLTSECDTLIPPSLFREFWRRLPVSKHGHWTRVSDGDHLLLEQKPELVLEWLKSILLLT